MNPEITELLARVRACTHCEAHLPLGPRPVLQVHPGAKILVAGQAPGHAVHQSGIPFHDPSGDRLGEWMGIGKDVFYDAARIAILPAGFCYPGKGKNGDLPPRKECRELWYDELLAVLSKIELVLPIGQYAQAYWLGKERKKGLTATVQSWEEYLPRYFPLPHPSPLNNIWLKKNPWFVQEVVPALQERVQQILMHA